MTSQLESRRYVVTGSTGLIGRRLCAALGEGGGRVDRLVRPGAAVDETQIVWDWFAFNSLPA